MVRRKSMREFAWPMTLRTETSMIDFSNVVFSSQEVIEKAVALTPHWRTSFSCMALRRDVLPPSLMSSFQPNVRKRILPLVYWLTKCGWHESAKT